MTVSLFFPTARALSRTALLLGAGLLGACSFTKDNSEPPAPLVEFKSSLQVQQLWSESTGADSRKAYLNLTPAVGEGRIFVATPAGQVLAYGAERGERLWDSKTKLPLSSGPGLGDDLVIIGGAKGAVIALRAEDGSEAWRAQVSSEVLAPPQATAGVVVVRSGNGRLTGLNSSDGHLLWVYERTVPALSLRGNSAPLIANNVVFAGFDSGKLSALDLRSGKPLWEVQVAQAHGRSELERMVDIDANLWIADGVLYVTAYQGQTAALSLTSGEVLWNRETSIYTGFTLDNRAIYVSDATGYVQAYDRDSGASLWKQDKLRGRRLSAPVSLGEAVVVGDYEGYLHWLRKEDGQFLARVATDKSGIRATPLVLDDRLVALSNKGSLYLLQATVSE